MRRCDDDSGCWLCRPERHPVAACFLVACSVLSIVGSLAYVAEWIYVALPH